LIRIERNCDKHSKGVTLLELILALSLSVMLLMSIGMAINLYFRMLDVRRTNVEEAQIARAVLKQFADDLRTQVAPFKLDVSGLEAVVANAATAAANSASGAAGGMVIPGGSGGGGGGFGGGGGGNGGGGRGGNDGGGRGGQGGDDGGGGRDGQGGNDGGGRGGPQSGNNNQDSRSPGRQDNQGPQSGNQDGPTATGGKGQQGGGGGQFAGGGTGGGQQGKGGQQGGKQGGNRGGGGIGGGMMVGGGVVVPTGAGQQAGQQTGAAASTDPNAATTTGEATEPTNVVSLYGTSTELRFDISRLPRVEQYQGSMAADASGELVATDVPSDVKTVNYFLLSDESADSAASAFNVSGSITPSTTGRGRGLMRSELDRAVTLYSEANGQLESSYDGAKILAQEIVGLAFRYHDGSSWSQDWDSKTYGGLPRAIEITLTLQPTYALNDAALAKADPLSGTSPLEQEFRLIVNLPSAPLVPETTAPATDTTDPAAAAGSTSGAGAGATSAGGALQ
jgi:hypothetical protein